MFEKLQTDYQRFLELERALHDPEAMAEPARANALAKEHGRLAQVCLLYGQYLTLRDRVVEAEQLLEAEDDAEMKEYAREELDELREEEARVGDQLRDRLYDQRVGTDHAGLLVEVRAGIGGDEAALFVRDLMEMYRAFADSERWRFEALSLMPTELGGFREVTFSVRGDGAYRALQFESGVHRVQRVPATETQGRIHTSAATVAVLPEVEDLDVEIRDEDLEVDVMRSGGPGGQHQNKTESGVRMTHKPSGIVVNCRDERSQHKNRAKALRILRSRLFERERERAQSERAELRRTLIGSGARSQRIRTYNFPQNRVTDHRIGLSLNLNQIVAGDLRPLTRALIDFDRREQLGE